MSDLRAFVDDIMDVAVVPSFTDVGYRVRRRLFDWQDLDELSMAGKVALVTGGSSGLGLVGARDLARMDAAVRLVVRDAAKGERAAEEVRAAAPGADVDLYVADLSELSAVRGLVEEVLAREERLDVLIHNAGALLHERRESADGHEMTFATMVLGPFALTTGLVPLLERTGAGRVIFVSSGGMYLQRLHVDDLETASGPYRGSLAYARAKRAQVLLAHEWARRLRDRGIVVHAMHPGWADTPGLEEGLPTFRRVMGPWLRTPEQGADTIAWLAAAPEAGRSTGRFWLDRRPRPIDRLPWTRATGDERERLWEACEGMTADG